MMFQLAGWKYDELSTKLLRNKKFCHMRYLLFWDISSADPGMLILSQKTIRLYDPMELQSWAESWKMKQQTQTHPPPLPQSQIMVETRFY